MCLFYLLNNHRIRPEKLETVKGVSMTNSLNVSDNDTRNLTVISRQNVLDKDFTVYGSVENPLFLAKDVAEWIDYTKTSKGAFDVSNMLKSIDEDEKMVRKIFVSSKMRDVWMLDLAGTSSSTREETQ